MADKAINTMFYILFKIIAMQLAAAISAVCLPIMVLGKLCPTLIIAPNSNKTSGHTKSQQPRKKVSVVASSSVPPAPNPRSIKTPGVPKTVAKKYQKLTQHEAGWLTAYYKRNVDFWSEHKIQPLASQSPAYQKKLDLVLTEGCGEKSDLNSLSFAKFVCDQKGLPYTGIICFTVMITGDFLQLDPPR